MIMCLGVGNPFVIDEVSAFVIVGVSPQKVFFSSGRWNNLLVFEWLLGGHSVSNTTIEKFESTIAPELSRYEVGVSLRLKIDCASERVSQLTGYVSVEYDRCFQYWLDLESVLTYTL